MPAWVFGHQMQCWQNGGRKNCKKNQTFKMMEGDLHNLVPAIGELNGDRSNFKFTEIAGESRNYGACNFEVDFKSRLVEPREEVKGDVARIYFYMRDTYNVKISDKQTKMLNAWNNIDPVNDWEIKKNELVYSIQGNRNPYISSVK